MSRVKLAHVLALLALSAPVFAMGLVVVGLNLYAVQQRLDREKAKPREVYAKAWPEKWGPGDALNATKRLRPYLTESTVDKASGKRITCQLFIAPTDDASVRVCFYDTAEPPSHGRPAPAA